MVWFHRKPVSQLSNTVDVKTVNSFIENSGALRYHVHSLSTGCVSAHVRPKTVQYAIEKGHTDLELWVFVNPLVKITKPDHRGLMRNSWEHNGKTQSFVLDYDDLTGVNSIEDFITVHVARNVPLPYYISQTGPNHFHSMYLGKKNEWNSDKREWLIRKWAGVDNESTDPVEIFNKISESHIDTNYYSQHYGKHKIRVPGSINQNHKNSDGSFWVVKGWLNNNYDNADQQYYEEISKPRPNYVPSSVVVSIASKESVKKRFKPDLFVDSILSLLEDLCPDGFSTKTENVAKMLSSNVGWLLQNDCRILQTRWAKEWGCTQVDVSRIIAKLIGRGILIKVSDRYSIGKFSKSYGAGDNLKDVVHWTGHSLPQPSWVRWDDGTSNQRMLYDVRYFVSLGLDTADILTRLHERQAHRTSKKIRSTRDFLLCINRVQEWNKQHAGAKELGLDAVADWWI